MKTTMILRVFLRIQKKLLI